MTQTGVEGAGLFIKLVWQTAWLGTTPPVSTTSTIKAAHKTLS